ncbi:hypothetical protein [Oceanobacillus salinisoli]|nr:hypothetical protein [Oceanobacillus salinisoli]
MEKKNNPELDTFTILNPDFTVENQDLNVKSGADNPEELKSESMVQ